MRIPNSVKHDMSRLCLRGACFAVLLISSVLVARPLAAQNSRFTSSPTTTQTRTQSPLFNQPASTNGSANAVETAASSVEAAANEVVVDTSAESSTSETVSESASAKQSTTAWASQLMKTIGSAGPMMIPILGCSILLVMFALERAITLRKTRVIPKHFAKLFLNELQEGQLKPVEALELCEENKSPISEVFAAAVKKWNRPSVEVEQAVIDEGERVANGLRRYLRLFNGIATISPLLGLLGTVLGMITAFNEIASSNAMGRPEQLANGISQALLTTAGGLSVAIPAYIAYMYFSSRVDQLIMQIDSLGQQVVNTIASDAWKAKDTRKGKKAA